VADDAAGEAGALVAEVDLALVQHHAALPGQHGLAAHAEVDPDELVVLRGPALPGGRLLEHLQRAEHAGRRRPGALGHPLRSSVGGLLTRHDTGRGRLAVARRGRRTAVT